MLSSKKFTKEQCFQKIKYYCRYQERCHKEVREKLYSFGLWRADVEEIVTQLIEEDYLNEERFAVSFAGGHFRIKNWGRIKIRHELQLKQVSTYCIKSALKEIDEESYLKTIHKLACKKWEALKNETVLTRAAKVQVYLMQKGFEPDLAKKVITELRSSFQK